MNETFEVVLTKLFRLETEDEEQAIEYVGFATSIRPNDARNSSLKGTNAMHPCVRLEVLKL